MDLKYASFIKRSIAFCLDVLVVIILNYLISLIVLPSYGGITGLMGLNDFQFGEDLVKGAMTGVGAVMALFFVFLVGLIIGFFYEVFMLGSAKHATVGKMAMKIKIKKENGEDVSYFEAFFRTLIKYISGCSFIFLWLICLFSGKKQNLHDMIVKTIVVEST